MNSTMEGIFSVMLAIVGVATVAVLVSRQAATSSVIREAGNAFSTAIGAAVSPVTGGTSPGAGSRGVYGGSFLGGFDAPTLF